MSSGFTPKIGDLGESCHVSCAKDLAKTGATPYYAAPELITPVLYHGKLLNPFTYAIDVFAFGLILSELFFGISPGSIGYERHMPKTDQIQRVMIESERRLREETTIVKRFLTHLRDLMGDCLKDHEPWRRPSISIVKNKLCFILAFYHAVLI